jgi:hypothetical protein
MKRILFFLLFATSCPCWAQTPYKPFVEEGKVWKMKSGNNDLQYFIKGDTVIGDKECKKLYSFNAGNTNAVDYKLALYETDRKVYFIPKNKEESYVLYDFTVPVNETTFVNEPLHPHDWPPLIMKNYERRSVNLMGTERTCVLMRRIHEDMDILLSGWWIEGVGGEQGPLNAWLFRAHGNQTYLKECSVNGQVIFSSSDFNQNITTISNICAPFMYEDKVWTMGYRTNQNVLKNSETKLCGDTIIDGIHFKRKYERGWLKGEKKPDEWTATDEYIGQNLGKVYMYSNKLKRAKIDMDFSLSEGDTFTCCGYEDNDERQTFLVTGIEQKWGFEDLVRKKFIYLQSKDNPDITDTWIEGIGSMTTGITGTSHLIPDGSACKLTLHTWGDIILHVAEDFSTSVRTVEQAKHSEATIYDLQGRKIANSQLKAGIYIRDGRKVVVE